MSSIKVLISVCSTHHSPVFRGLQMTYGKVVCGLEVGDQGSLLACDQDGTLASREI